MLHLRLLPALALGALLCAGCATHESFRVPVVRPAPVDLGQHQLVAVDRFEGEGADAVDHDVTTALREAVNPLTSRPDFEVVHESDVERVIEDMRRYPDADLDGEGSPLTKWKNAPVQIKGDVHRHRVQQEDSARRWIDPQGRPHTVFTRSAVARVSVTIEITAGSTPMDRVLLEEEVSATTEAVDREPDPIDHDALLAAARERVVQGYLRRVMPHFDQIAVQLFVDGDLPQLEVGNGFAKTGEWEAALDAYSGALTAASGDTRHKALHNIGVAQLYSNRFDEARRTLQEAYALGKDDSTLRQLEMVAQRETELAALQQRSERMHATPGR